MGQRNRLLSKFALILLLGAGPAGLGALQAADEKIGLMLEASFAAPKIHKPIPGAKKTVLVPAKITKYGADTFSEKEWSDSNLDWPAVEGMAFANANELSEKVEIQWFRDDRQIVLYGAILSEDPFVSSVIYSKTFLEKFREKLGEKILVVVPDRNTVYVFPRFGNQLEELAPALAERYRNATYKVSLELLQPAASGWRAVGAIDPNSDRSVVKSVDIVEESAEE